MRSDTTDRPDVDAVVNAANAELLPGGGGATPGPPAPASQQGATRTPRSAPGRGCSPAGVGCPPPVLHCLGPVFGVDRLASRRLADGYRNALALAEDQGLASVAFPAISDGAFGHPMATPPPAPSVP